MSQDGLSKRGHASSQQNTKHHFISMAVTTRKRRLAPSSEEESSSSDRNPQKRSSPPSNLTSNERASSAGQEAKARFILPKNVPAFTWKWLENTNADPAKQSLNCCRLLLENCFIDKSAILHHILKENFNAKEDDFWSVPLLLVYPRRFAKTTLLGFMEAVFSPVHSLGDNYQMDEVRTKIAALECGGKLLEYGWRPVVSLDLQGISDVNDLNHYIADRLERAGLEDYKVDLTLEPRRQLLRGVKMLNEQFKKNFGINRNTIVLVDEYDDLFRDHEIDKDQKKKRCGCGNPEDLRAW
jgi:hypothetical protein